MKLVAKIVKRSGNVAVGFALLPFAIVALAAMILIGALQWAELHAGEEAASKRMWR